MVDLKWTGNQLSTGTPVKLTNDNGTNSQPSFSLDGRSVVFSATRDTGSSDIYRIDLATRTETRVTRTPENENSPTMNAAGEYVAVRWVPATLFKEFGPWVYSADGTPTRGVLRAPDTTGYYTPLGSGDYALTRPKSKTFTIGLFDTQSGTITDIDSGVPALPAQLIPGQRALSYVRIDSTDGKHTLRRVDLATNRTSSIGSTIVGRAAHAWIPRHNTVLMAKGNVLYARGTLSRLARGGRSSRISAREAYVVSPNGDKLVLASPNRRFASCSVLTRAGPAAGVRPSRPVAGCGSWNIAVTENPIFALGYDRLQRKFRGRLALILCPDIFSPILPLDRSVRLCQRAAGDARPPYSIAYVALEPRATEAIGRCRAIERDQRTA